MTYAQQVQSQIAQYQDCENIHDLPPVYHAWSARHLQPRFAQVLGVSGVPELYALQIAEAVAATGRREAVSLGAGDCSVEIAVAKLLRQGGLPVRLRCLELSPVLLARGREAVAAAGLGEVLLLEERDLNQWQSGGPLAAVMAHHALHHLVELEKVFDEVHRAIAGGGRFVTCDMIGRNGHMRWPEALELLQALWKRLPSAYRVNRQLRRHEEVFDNFDCSREGFEGVRAQDVLPLLVERFGFLRFLGYGNLADVLVERSFGPNFSPERHADLAFIDFVQALNDRLVDQGRLKPTMMAAVMQAEPVARPRIWRHWTPAFCVRSPGEPHRPAAEAEIERLLAGCPDVPPEPGALPFGVTRLDFGALGNGLALLAGGWSAPEATHCWSVAEAAAVDLPLPGMVRADLVLAVAAQPYLSAAVPRQRLEVAVNDRVVAERVHSYGDSPPREPLRVLAPHALLAASRRARVTLRVSALRDPACEGGDSRTLGCCLQALAVEVRVARAGA